VICTTRYRVRIQIAEVIITQGQVFRIGLFLMSPEMCLCEFHHRKKQVTFPESHICNDDILCFLAGRKHY
jgi:hypothetical protein